MQFYSLTDCGRLRTNNEDYCMAKQIGGYTVLILADGMGGHCGGEIASRKAIETVFSYLEDIFVHSVVPSQIPSILSKVVDKANNVIYELSKSESSLKGMGTTLDICIVTENTAYISHVGDSRVYKITEDGNIMRLTKDHSLIEYMLDTGAITPEEAINHPQRNVITRALGTCPLIDADISYFNLLKSDRLLLCSDGLTNMLSDDEICAVMKSESSLKERAEKLIRLANDAGGTDNITVVLAQY